MGSCTAGTALGVWMDVGSGSVHKAVLTLACPWLHQCTPSQTVPSLGKIASVLLEWKLWFGNQFWKAEPPRWVKQKGQVHLVSQSALEGCVMQESSDSPGLQIMSWWRIGKVKRKMCYSAPELSCPSFSLQFKHDSLHIQMRTSHLEFLCFLCLSNCIEDSWIPSKVNALRP